MMDLPEKLYTLNWVSTVRGEVQVHLGHRLRIKYMNEPDLQPSPRKRLCRLKWGRRLVLLGIILVSVPLLVLGIARFIGIQQLREATTEADRLDPGWRLLELEANLD